MTDILIKKEATNESQTRTTDQETGTAHLTRDSLLGNCPREELSAQSEAITEVLKKIMTRPLSHHHFGF